MKNNLHRHRVVEKPLFNKDSRGAWGQARPMEPSPNLHTPHRYSGRATLAGTGRMLARGQAVAVHGQALLAEKWYDFSESGTAFQKVVRLFHVQAVNRP